LIATAALRRVQGVTELGEGVLIKLRFILLLLAIGSSLVTDGWAQSKAVKKRTPTPVLKMDSQVSGTLAVQLVNAANGVAMKIGNGSQRSMDLGTVSYQNGSNTLNVSVQKLSTSFVVSSSFGLEVDDATGKVGSVTVLAGLAAPDVFIFRVDGFQLGTTPQLIQAKVKPGSQVQHLLEIEVSTSLTERNSQLQNTILFQVVAN
jgi:hypothetical protein